MFGKKPGASRPSGGNVQRENFAKSANAGAKEPRGGKAMPEEHKVEGASENGTTTITHHGDGSHSVDHADGEHSDHPTTGHMVTHLHGKHADGEAMHVHHHGGNEHSEGKPVTTHHHGHDGMVEGPHHHGSMDEAAEHMKATIGDDGGNGAQQMAPSEMPGEGADLY